MSNILKNTLRDKLSARLNQVLAAKRSSELPAGVQIVSPNGLSFTKHADGTWTEDNYHCVDCIEVFTSEEMDQRCDRLGFDITGVSILDVDDE